MNNAQSYLNGKEAAEYLGYKYYAFRLMVDAWQLPKYGPKRNRYKKADLDEFMDNPLAFTGVVNVRARRPKSGFTPVSIN